MKTKIRYKTQLMRQLKESKVYRKKEVDKDFDKLNFKFAVVTFGAFALWLGFIVYILIHFIKAFIV
jgi:hypothetical protein